MRRMGKLPGRLNGGGASAILWKTDAVVLVNGVMKRRESNTRLRERTADTTVGGGAGSDWCAWQQVLSDFAVVLQCCIIPWQQPCWAVGVKQASAGIAAHSTTTANNTNTPRLPLCMVYSLIHPPFIIHGQAQFHSDPNHMNRFKRCRFVRMGSPTGCARALMLTLTC
jgi:hypothetical protein